MLEGDVVEKGLRVDDTFLSRAKVSVVWHTSEVAWVCNVFVWRLRGCLVKPAD